MLSNVVSPPMNCWPNDFSSGLGAFEGSAGGPAPSALRPFISRATDW
ncbi:hypothetical protein [Streptomyces endophytica]|uniref:Uncharacterized protein n=1 Tax=Streptomyces endophytica TaxID=2991496 RepID=A0ABY6PCB0_9ACTN|nr:hypothetical protein [Streptomyces endophytica]UZJ31483.1 hypothetical protein OJ254_15685 [Streptomyces endophytica]